MDAATGAVPSEHTSKYGMLPFAQIVNAGALFTIRDLYCGPIRPGRAAMSTARLPVTNGAARLVPEEIRYGLGPWLVESAVTTSSLPSLSLPPTAIRSGLILPVGVGPTGE